MSFSRLPFSVLKVAVFIVITLSLTPSIWAWGPLGHRVASQVAEARLTPRALAAVRELLGPGVTLADISTWADEQREVKNSAPWHYVDVPITESRYEPKYCQPEGCVVSRIDDFGRVLVDPRSGKAEKKEALRFLIHFIEDLHQPLHVGDTGSRGGNDIQVRFFDSGSNLHRVWDSHIIEHESANEQDWLRDINSLATLENSAEWSKGTPEDWATESLQTAKQAYCLPGTRTVMRSGTKLDDNYCRIAVPIIRIQLAKAGIRVATILNATFR